MSKGLPDYDSQYIDHYGYYNGSSIVTPWNSADRTYSSMLPAVNIDKDGNPPSSNCYIIYESSSQLLEATCTGSLLSTPSHFGRESNFEDAKANILEEIHFPTGAYQKLIYEASGYHAMGIRVNKISDFDENGNEVDHKIFKYENEVVIGKPVYHYIFENTQTNGDAINTVHVSSNSFTNIFDVNGSPIRYGKVTTISKDNSYVIRVYSTQTDDQSNVQYYINGTKQGPELTYIPSTDIPFVPPSTRFWERGLIEKETYYEYFIENDPNPNAIRETTYNYKINSSIRNTTVAYKPMYFKIHASTLNGRHIGLEKYISKPVFLEKVTEKTYDQTTSTYVTSITDYEYEGTELQLLKTTSYNPNEDIKYISENKYITHSDYDNSSVATPPVDCIGIRTDCLNSGTDPTICYNNYTTCTQNQQYNTNAALAIKTMRSKHMVSAIVEQQSVIEKNGTKTLVGATINENILTGTNNEFIRPYKSWFINKRIPVGSYSSSSIDSNGELVKSSDFRRAVTYNTYDQSNGNLLSETDISGINTSYEWGYNNNLVTATTVNPGSDQIRTETTYKPLVGPLTETDASGYVTSYTYYNFNRLETIKDNDGNIVQAYDYHYKEPEQLDVSTNSLSFGSSNSNSNVDVTSNIDWSTAVTYSSGSGWISVSPSTQQNGDQTLTISVSNNSGSERTGKVTVSDASGNGLPDQEIDVTQAEPTILTVSPSGLTDIFQSSTVPFPISITSNVSWTVTKTLWDNPTVNWMTVSSTSGSDNQTIYLDFFAQPPLNTTWSAQVEISGGGITRNVIVLWHN